MKVTAATERFSDLATCVVDTLPAILRSFCTSAGLQPVKLRADFFALRAGAALALDLALALAFTLDFGFAVFFAILALVIDELNR
ncbi:MAG: hypothetical protein EXR88_02330 [Gammaproteobacteria bacterium]|nr:hypothetical protein [Gammaproteobacteria bacterium]